MAKTTITQITDDIDGSADAQTYSLAFQGIEYTIDLGQKNADKLTKALQPYLEAGTKVGGRRSSSSSSSSRTSSKASRQDLADVRAWASAQGFEVSERGRIKADVLAAYDEAH